MDGTKLMGCCCVGYVDFLYHTPLPTGAPLYSGRMRQHASGLREVVYEIIESEHIAWPRYEPTFAGEGACLTHQWTGNPADGTDKMYAFDVETGTLGSLVWDSNLPIRVHHVGQDGYTTPGVSLGSPRIAGINSSGTPSPSGTFASFPDGPTNLLEGSGYLAYNHTNERIYEGHTGITVREWDSVTTEWIEITTLDATRVWQHMICSDDHLYALSWGVDGADDEVWRFDHTTLTPEFLGSLPPVEIGYEDNDANTATILPEARTPPGYGECVYLGALNPIRVRMSDLLVERAFPGVTFGAGTFMDNRTPTSICLDRSRMI